MEFLACFKNILVVRKDACYVVAQRAGNIISNTRRFALLDNRVHTLLNCQVNPVFGHARDFDGKSFKLFRV